MVNSVGCSLNDVAIAAMGSTSAASIGAMITLGIITSVFTGGAAVLWSAFEVL